MDKELIEALARAYSGAPFPSKASLTKSERALKTYNAYLADKGLVVVPREPTEAMMEAVDKAEDALGYCHVANESMSCDLAWPIMINAAQNA